MIFYKFIIHYLYFYNIHIMTLDLSNKLPIDFPDLSMCDFVENLNCSRNEFDDIPIIYLPISLITLNCSLVFLEELPDLSILISLRKLDCSYNRLSKLPKLPSSLRILDCSYNYLSELKNLPVLFILNCCNNKLKELPNLPILPHINFKIKCYGLPFSSYESNKLPYRILTIECINNTNKVLNNFRYTYYSLKFKKAFRKWLYEKIRLPKIEKEFSPNSIRKALEKIDVNDNDQFDKIIEFIDSKI